MAMDFLQKALDIFERVLGQEHPNTKIVQKNMAILQAKMKANQ
jgi:hypothetical protein